jgi:site-specific DNA-methyltransferase (adenine-specific)
MSLPKPYYQDSAVTLYHGDCREIVPLLGRFDLLLTDPPYGVSATRKSRLTENLAAKVDHWDDEACDAETLNAFREKVINAVIWGGNCFGLPAQPGWLCWDKINDGRNFSEFELAWTDAPIVPRFYRCRPQNMDGGKEHPTQKPILLMTWCLSFFPDAVTVLDPFADSGTTGRACKDLGRKCTMIEREERYCEIAARRMGQEVLPLEATA